MRRVLCLVALCGSVAAPAAAQAVTTVAWDPSLYAEGYFVQTGTGTGQVTAEQNVGNVTLAALSLPVGTTYVRVLAYNTLGVSGPSNELVVTIAPPPPPPPPPTDSCAITPLAVTVTQWPVNKHQGTLFYTSNYPVVKSVVSFRGQTPVSATFTDARGCTRTETR